MPPNARTPTRSNMPKVSAMAVIIRTDRDGLRTVNILIKKKKQEVCVVRVITNGKKKIKKESKTKIETLKNHHLYYLI